MNNQNLPNDLNLAVVGNCSFSALINRNARVVWSCLPHFDGDPVFCSLLNSPKDPDNTPDDEWGFWDFELEDFDKSEQFYIENTAILVTRLYSKQGDAIEIVDLAPRFPHYERIFSPSGILRTIKPLQGTPRIRIRLRPRFNYGELEPKVIHSGNSIRYISDELMLRLTTDAPVTCVRDELIFTVDGEYNFFFGLDEPLRKGIQSTSRRYRDETERYWKYFSSKLAIPFEWQDAVIRAAITLKLCTFEDTGAVLAALTTSIPESANSTRNWDYRFCWVRDSLFLVNTLNRLGTTTTMRDYLRFIKNISLQKNDEDLQPLYSISLQSSLEEWEAPCLSGYRGMGPVRIGNEAHIQQQNDVWGCAILALTQAFFDKRIENPATVEDFYHLERFGESAAKNFDTPDAGIWEFRTIGRVHTFSAVMCWVACDRLAKIAKRFDLDDRAAYWRKHADKIHKVIMEKGWSEKKQSFVEPFGGEHLDASLLLLHEVGFIDAKDPKFVKTVEAVEKELIQDGMLYRYIYEDDFGKPEVTFTICTFWYIDALAACGRKDEARELFEIMLSRCNHVGLLSEDMDFKTGELWGNFPQTYSMVGMINCAMRLSKTWQESI